MSWVKPERWLTPREVAEMLGISRRSVNNWRRRGIGPAYTKLGASARYRLEDIEKWIADNTVNPSGSDVLIYEPDDDKKELVA
jgi:excisionase family DNA binding protein